MLAVKTNIGMHHSPWHPVWYSTWHPVWHHHGTQYGITNASTMVLTWHPVWHNHGIQYGITMAPSMELWTIQGTPYNNTHTVIAELQHGCWGQPTQCDRAGALAVEMKALIYFRFIIFSPFLVPERRQMAWPG